MKTTMKKLATVLLTMILVLQVMPVFADQIYSTTQGPIDNYRDKLQVTSPSSVILVGTSIDMSATAGYILTWESKPADVAEVDAYGRVTAIAPGIVRITASEGSYKDSVILHVVEKENTSSEEEIMMIVINGNKEKITYDGQGHELGYTASSNSANFSADLVKMTNEAKTVVATECGVYQTKYEASDFTYEGNANAEFIISDGWMQIKPATVMIELGKYTKKWGDPDPDFMDGITVEGLMGEDTIEALNLQIVREEGENAGFYVVTLANTEKTAGNYRLSVTDGILAIEKPRVKIRSSMEGVTEAVAGTEVVLTAEMDGLDTERFSIQWQMGNTPDADSMTDIEGANEPVYTYILNENTAGKYFRVLINLK